MPILEKDGGIVMGNGGVFDTTTGSDCCCAPPSPWVKALPCPCDTLPPGAPHYLVFPISSLPPGGADLVFLDPVWLVCWFIDQPAPPYTPIAGDQFVTTFLPQTSCASCCTPTCPTFAEAPASVTVTVNWTFNGVDPPNESPPATTLTWTMTKSVDGSGKAEYLVSPFECHFGVICCTAGGCSMRWLATLQCDSPQAPGMWRIAFTFESAPMTFGVCDAVPPACPGGIRFYGVSAVRPIPSPIGTYTIQSQTPDVTTVTVTVS